MGANVIGGLGTFASGLSQGLQAGQQRRRQHELLELEREGLGLRKRELDSQLKQRELQGKQQDLYLQMLSPFLQQFLGGLQAPSPILPQQGPQPNLTPLMPGQLAPEQTDVLGPKWMFTPVAQKWGEQITRIGREVGLDPAVGTVLVQLESNGNPQAVAREPGVNGARGQGLTQLTPATAQRQGVTDVFDPEQNLRGGLGFFKEQLEASHGNVHQAAYRYHQGSLEGYRNYQTNPKSNRYADLFASTAMHLGWKPGAQAPVEQRVAGPGAPRPDVSMTLGPGGPSFTVKPRQPREAQGQLDEVTSELTRGQYQHFFGAPASVQSMVRQKLRAERREDLLMQAEVAAAPVKALAEKEAAVTEARERVKAEFQPLPAEQGLKLADAQSSIDAMDQLMALYDPRFVGPVEGRQARLKGFTGEISERNADFQAYRQGLENDITRFISGANVPEGEANRMKRQIPQENDSDVVFERKMRTLREMAYNALKRRTEALKKAGYRNVPEFEARQTPGNGKQATSTGATLKPGERVVNGVIIGGGQ